MKFMKFNDGLEKKVFYKLCKKKKIFRENYKLFKKDRNEGLKKKII